MNKRCLVDAVLFRNPELDEKALMKMTASALLGLLPIVDNPAPIILAEDTDPRHASLRDNEGHFFTHRKRTKTKRL